MLSTWSFYEISTACINGPDFIGWFQQGTTLTSQVVIGSACVLRYKIESCILDNPLLAKLDFY